MTWSPASSRASGLETLPGWRHASARSSVPIASAKADAAYDTGDVYKTLENHRAHRLPKVLIPPRKGAQLALDSAGTRQRNRNIRARSRVGKRKWYVASGDSRRSKVETTFHRYKAILGSAMRARGLASPESRGEVGVQDPEHHDGARDTRWRDDRMTGRRSHGRLSALNGVVHQGRSEPPLSPWHARPDTRLCSLAEMSSASSELPGTPERTGFAPTCRSARTTRGRSRCAGSRWGGSTFLVNKRGVRIRRGDRQPRRRCHAVALRDQRLRLSGHLQSHRPDDEVAGNRATS